MGKEKKKKERERKERKKREREGKRRKEKEKEGKGCEILIIKFLTSLTRSTKNERKKKFC